MPIRMSKDNNGNANDNFPSGGGGGGGGKGFGNLIPLIIGLLFRYPKLLIVVLVIGGLVYWFGGSNNGLMQQAASILTTGCNFDQQEYDKAEVFEPLANNDKNPLPESVSLEKYCPERLNQGEQGSCVAWSSAYACRSILEAQLTGSDPNTVAFSPSFLYNQIGLEGCQGSYIIRAMEKMKDDGLVPFDKFPYNDQDCSKQPTTDLKRMAQQYTMPGFNRLTVNGDDYKIDLNAIRQNLSQGAPVVIGMMVGGSFMQGMMGKNTWIPEDQDYQMNGFGGHAMCIIGYDDYLEGGAFQLMNSWGKEWGENGIGWVRYKDFQFFGKEAYGVYPMGESAKPVSATFSLGLALVDNSSSKRIVLKEQGDHVFRTVNPIAQSTRFKIEIENSAACYTYIFGEETDGSSYILFPYTPKHSPYCGITGTRLFPKDYSLTPDSLSKNDRIVIIVTKAPVDFNAMNARINKSPGKNYILKTTEAIGKYAFPGGNFTAGEQVRFEGNNLSDENALVIFFEIEVEGR